MNNMPGLSTTAIHAGDSHDESHAHVLPIYQNSTYPPEHVIFNQVSSILFISGTFDPGSGIAPVLFSSDLGNTWHNIPVTIRNSVTDLELDVNGNLYIATFDSGLFRKDPALLEISHSPDRPPTDDR